MASAVQAQGSGPGTLSNNLFQQYYTQGGANLTDAALYPAPHPVPYKVGNVYYTYQPLMPHEMMWQHSRNYYNYYAPPSAFYTDPCKGGGFGGLNKTTVVWGSTCTNHMGPLPGSTSTAACSITGTASVVKVAVTACWVAAAMAGTAPVATAVAMACTAASTGTTCCTAIKATAARASAAALPAVAPPAQPLPNRLVSFNANHPTASCILADGFSIANLITKHFSSISGESLR
jgi:hypothetical protein